MVTINITIITTISITITIIITICNYVNKALPCCGQD